MKSDYLYFSLRNSVEDKLPIKLRIRSVTKVLVVLVFRMRYIFSVF
jgi:hypothetical protein